jgi:ferredoxin
MTHVVTENCQDCRFTDCVTSCPVAAFHLGDERVYISASICIDCGACVDICPVRAIVEEYDLPEDQHHWLDINANEAMRLPVVRAKLIPLPGAEEKQRSLGY